MARTVAWREPVLDPATYGRCDVAFKPGGPSAIHVSTLADGRAFCFGFGDGGMGPDPGSFVIDPARRARPRARRPSTTCSALGHVLLPDGRLVIMGGHWRRGQGGPPVRPGDRHPRAPRRYAARALVSDRDRAARRTSGRDVRIAAHRADQRQESGQRDSPGVRRDQARRPPPVRRRAHPVAVLTSLPGRATRTSTSTRGTSCCPTDGYSSTAATRRASGTPGPQATGTPRSSRPSATSHAPIPARAPA